MSYTVNTPCGNCIKKKDGCSDGIVVTGAVQGIIHPMIFGKGHQGSGSVDMTCHNKVVEEVKEG